LLKGNRSICDGTFSLKVNRCKPSLREYGQKSFYQVDSFRKCVANATVFVKNAGERMELARQMAGGKGGRYGDLDAT
jgi:hypothetical protein